MFKCVLTSLLEIKSFVSLKIESLLFWTRVHFKKGGGAKGGGGALSDLEFFGWD